MPGAKRKRRKMSGPFNSPRPTGIPARHAVAMPLPNMEFCFHQDFRSTNFAVGPPDSAALRQLEACVPMVKEVSLADNAVSC